MGNKKEDRLYKEFGIRNDYLYKIIGIDFEIIGEILNFDCVKFAIKSYDKKGENNFYKIKYKEIGHIEPFMTIENFKKQLPKNDLYLKNLYFSSHYGQIGLPTNLTDIYGKDLSIGDIVSIESKLDKERKIEDSVVVSDFSKFFIMGLYHLNLVNGENDNFKITFKRSWKTLKEGEKIPRDFIVSKNK